jgi:multidrug resistance efflux pump
MRKIVLTVLIVVLVVGAGAFWLFSSPSPAAQRATAAPSIGASGFIEAEEVSIAAEVGGRIKTISFDEGDEVRQGDILVLLDTTLLDAQAQQAQASLVLARASLAEEIRHIEHQVRQAIAAREGARQAWTDAVALKDNPQELEAKIVAARAQLEIAQRQVAMSKQAWENAVALRDSPQELEAQIIAARAQLEIAQRQVAMSKQAWENAVTLRDSPQELEAQIDAARAQLAVAEHQLEQAQAARDTAEKNLDNIKKIIGQNFLSWTSAYNAAKAAYDQAVSAVPVAQAARDGAKKNLDNLLATRDNPQILNTQVDAARGQYDVAVATRDGARESLDNLLATKENPIELNAMANAAKSRFDQASVAVEIAQNNLQALQRGPENEEVAIARARVVRAQAALDLIKAQRDKMTLYSPIAGVVSNRPGNVGEIASPGMSLLTMVNLDEVKLTVYVPEAEIGKVKVGQKVEVTVDSYPDKTFDGYVVYIAPRAEFTPRNIQTKGERVKTVFAVKVRLPNPDHILKPGMPADAKIKL